MFIGLGANLADRAGAIGRGIERLDREPRIDVIRSSQLHPTAAWGVFDQPDYLNAVVEIATDLAPTELVERLLSIERDLGRLRAEGTRWAARTIDMDLLLYRDLVVDEPGCRVPHPHLHERAFALRPLLEIAPDVSIPGRGRAAACLGGLEPAPKVAVA